MKVAFLHTLNANIDLFTPYIDRYLPNIEIQHFVSEDLLKNAMQFGVEHVRQDVNKVINDIAKHKADIIICSCSTIGRAGSCIFY
ncbi:hypothetical protein [Psychromonas hadalis]|uniref:hypothetical protein n=1 Tax=Psychromonas hadalis TaxID=211669 RepID=UPI0003B5F696|nr:hypothetical protein [Psychromonas hadalis]